MQTIFSPARPRYTVNPRAPAGRIRRAAVYDAHIHLADPAYDPIRDAVMSSMDALDAAAFCVSTSAEDSETTVRLCGGEDRLAAFVGIHPDSAGDDASRIAGIVDAHPDIVCGIGEIGLDPTVSDERGYGRQSDVFASMLALAESRGLPVSIHSRRSVEDVLGALSSYDVRALLHWFDGSKRQLGRATDSGIYVSYGPASVYAEDKRVLMSRTDPAFMLVETDGPVRFSRCFERAPAQPCHVPSVIHRAAEALGSTYEDTRMQIAENSRRYLGE